MKVRFQKITEIAKVPQKAHATDAGFDMTAISKIIDEYGCVVYGTGIAVEIPDGYVGLLFPRSSNAKKGLILTNSVGVIDSGYRGEIIFKYRPTNTYYDFAGRVRNNADLPSYDIGERIGQLIIIPYPEIEFEEAKELAKSDRGQGGYGSTGK